jgi:hypothetical protein
MSAESLPFLLLAFALGASIGSFLNVCIARWPHDLSVVRPPSRCPKCERPIRWHENVPLLGWLMLRGRRAEDGTGVAGVLDAVEEQDAGGVRERLVRPRATGDLRHDEDPLRRLGLGGGGEVGGGDVEDLDVSRLEVGPQRAAARRLLERRRDERAAQRDGRAPQLLAGADALGDEERLALPRAPAPEVAG